ncbi:MAG: hypothetical protein GY696_35575, partial [Gammaproteobacteria bacterium]|nr:hypothetical protein [Gammaproteobacteria bacterium]
MPSSSVFAVASNYFTLENDDDFKTMLPFYLQIAWESVREESEKAKERQKVQYDKTAKVPPFEVGDKVFVQSKELKRCKLSRKYRGPGVILRKTDTNAEVQLKMNRGVEIKKFHLDKLTKAYPDLGDRVFSGNPRHPVQPPSVRSAEAAEAFSGEGRRLKAAVTKEVLSQTEGRVAPPEHVNIQTKQPRYSLRSRGKKELGHHPVHRIRVSTMCKGISSNN